MQKIELRPLNKRERQLVTEFGIFWVLKEIRRVACFNMELGALIESCCGQHSRWILASRLTSQVRGDIVAP